MNLQQFQVINTGQVLSFVVGDQTLTIPILLLSGVVCGDDGRFLADYTGANALIFPHFFTKIPFLSETNLSLSSFLEEYATVLFSYKLQLGNS